MLETLQTYLERPALYAPSTGRFWDDPHISKSMLEAHLNPEEEGATRKPAFLDASDKWIAGIAPPDRYPELLDLGCGPGLYARRFDAAGYRVTGIDLSMRSIAYAREQAERSGRQIDYRMENYLELRAEEAYDLIALIYCDYGPLSPPDRAVLARAVYRALKPGGIFLLDVFTPAQHQGTPESRDWAYHPEGGFWSAAPHLCLHGFLRYDSQQVVLNQYLVLTEQQLECYYIWEQCFTERSLRMEMEAAGFSSMQVFGDVAGKAYAPESKTLCMVLTKGA